MRLETPLYAPGDSFLLLDEFPYDWQADLPLALGESVYLSRLAFDLLASFGEGEAAFVLPKYGLPVGIDHCCLRMPRASGERSFDDVREEFFTSLARLRLVAPVPYRVEGQFTIGDDLLIEGTFGLFHVKAPGVAHPMNRVTSSQLNGCSQLEAILEGWESSNLSRLKVALTYFGQIVNGLVRSRQMATMGLFAALEALFGPEGRGDKAGLLAERVSGFLEDVPSTHGIHAAALERFIVQAYRQIRTNEVHGRIASQIAPEHASAPVERALVFSNLLEILRGSLLKTALLEQDEVIATYRTKRSYLERISEHCRARDRMRDVEIDAAAMHFVPLTDASEWSRQSPAFA